MNIIELDDYKIYFDEELDSLKNSFHKILFKAICIGDENTNQYCFVILQNHISNLTVQIHKVAK